MKRLFAFVMQVALVICLTFLFSGPPVYACGVSSLTRNTTIYRGLAGAEGEGLASSRPNAYIAKLSSSSVQYCEQICCTFTQNFTSLSYSVTAVAQMDADGFGPCYWLNGLGNAGAWYQAGLSYNWGTAGGGHVSGFRFSYEVWDTNGISVFPSVGSGLSSFSGNVNQGDSVTLSLYFSGGNVIMQAIDVNTGANALETYSSFGETTFVGKSSPGGAGTGLMTEWWHNSPYYGGETKVVYTENGTMSVSSAWIWIDEFPFGSSALFWSATKSPVSFNNPNQLQAFSSNGATAAMSSIEFITGGVATVPLTFGYSISGGAGSSPAPVLTYIVEGVTQTATLTQSTQTFAVDSGSNWSITNPISSSSTIERWQTAQSTTGATTSSQTLNLVFYHQYLVNFGFNVGEGGSSYSAPMVTCQQFGNQINPAIGTQVWADAAGYSYPNSLLGPSSSERWATNSASGVVLSPGSITAQYSHQYYVTVNLNPAAGGSVSVVSGWFNAGAALQATASADSGWLFENWTGTGQGSYSGSSSSDAAIVNSPLFETATFFPGLTIIASSKITVSYNYASSSGSILPGTSNTLFAPLGTIVQFTALPSSTFIYSFGGWTGSLENSDNSIVVALNYPLSLTANFGYNYTYIFVVIAVGIVLVLAVILLISRRRRIPKGW